MASRKKTYHGVTVGILMVNTRFRRFPGDIGNAETWPFPVQYRIVKDATPSHMTDLHRTSLLEPFKQAALELVDAGVDGITTTCGFLALYQRELADTCGVPVATSSLLQVPVVERLIPADKRVGIITYSAEGLTPAHLTAAGAPADSPVIGMPTNSAFVRSIREGDDTVPFEVLQAEVTETAQRLVQDSPDIGAVVLECTNLAPFSAAIHERVGLPIYDTVTLVNWFHAGLRPRRYRAEA